MKPINFRLANLAPGTLSGMADTLSTNPANQTTSNSSSLDGIFDPKITRMGRMRLRGIRRVRTSSEVSTNSLGKHKPLHSVLIERIAREIPRSHWRLAFSGLSMEWPHTAAGHISYGISVRPTLNAEVFHNDGWETLTHNRQYYMIPGSKLRLTINGSVHQLILPDPIEVNSRLNNAYSAMNFFGLRFPFTYDDAKKAFRELSKQTHPDLTHQVSSQSFTEVYTHWENLKWYFGK